MALVECPNCSKRISNRAAQCSHCGFDLHSVSEDKLQRIKRIKAIEKQQKLMTYSFLALLLFVAGFAITYLGDSETYPWMPVAGQAASATGFVWYIAIRAWTIWLKRK